MAKSNKTPAFLNNPEVVAWLASQSEFTADDFEEHDTEFFHRFPSANADNAAALETALPHMPPSLATHAQDYLTMRPREIAHKHGVSRKEAYGLTRRIRLAARRILQHLHDMPPNPEVITGVAPVRTLKFTAPNGVRYVHLFFVDDRAVWTNDRNEVFTEDVQAQLDNLLDISPTFEVLDVETA